MAPTSGRVIPCSGARVPKRKEPSLTAATLEKAERDEAQRLWGQRRFEEISQGINMEAENRPVDPEVYWAINDDPESDNEDILPNIPCPSTPGENNEDPRESDDDEEYVHFVSGDNYRRQRIQEDAHWKEVMPKIFIAFMKCAEKTSYWGNDLMWNHDFNEIESCSCGNAPGLRRTRAVDTVDLFYRKKIEVQFCNCTPDQVRLINQGYLGATPKSPETAFSLRLLRFYHLAWKYCHANIQPFALMIDEFLDAYNALLLVPGTNEPRLWRRPLSAAVFCYRQLLKMVEQLEIRSLNLTPLQQLSSNCPRCFGPAGSSGINKGPQYIVCVDGNFQQRRHEKASRDFDEIRNSIPSLFMLAEDVSRWEPKKTSTSLTEVALDPCTIQHTAAADRRDGSSWRGSEETGLVGLACRHDHMLKIVNVIRSGERAHYVHALLGYLFDAILEARTETNSASLGVLYDIGCTLEKGVIKNNLFSDERAEDRLKFGTSAFHAYVHRWSCQLQYNPRLNTGWGFSDGEGLERNWVEISPLIAALRWASKQTRFDAIHLKIKHNITIKLRNAAKSANHKLKVAEKRLSEARLVLANLESKSARLTFQYFSDQWDRQRSCQLEMMADDSLQKLQDRLAHLIDLEEEFRDAHNELTKLRRKRRRTMSEDELRQLRSLPSTLLAFEESIAEMVAEIGGDEFRDMPEVKDRRARALLRIRVAKEKVYEAKVGKIEWQKKWDKPGIGTSEQGRYKRIMEKRNKALLQKYNTYRANVEAYHVSYPDSPPQQLPTFEEVKSMEITNTFWNIGHLTHPNEPWAVDLDTQTGIQAIRTARSGEEEVERISYEVQNMARWALMMEERLSNLLAISEMPWVDGCPNGMRPEDIEEVIEILANHHINGFDQFLFPEIMDIHNVLKIGLSWGMAMNLFAQSWLFYLHIKKEIASYGQHSPPASSYKLLKNTPCSGLSQAPSSAPQAGPSRLSD
ncbi:hypothetical protein DFH28DRAFT_1129636 [Melampsora americana]|nr:hypothetical protein DFH28DRAFT_1129636 [Melampsora americana]